MPELPEVETVRRGLEQKLNNFIIKKVEVCRDSTIAFPTNKEEFIKGLQNSLIYKWERRGKYLIAQLKKIEKESIQFPLDKFSNNNELSPFIILFGDNPSLIHHIFPKLLTSMYLSSLLFLSKNLILVCLQG